MNDDEDGPPALSKRTAKFFRLARLTSRQSTATNFRLGAVIAKGGRVVGMGFNDPYKTHPASTTPYRYIHAELAAVLNARTDLHGASIYVFRAGHKERPLLSKPCQHCMALLRKVGIKTIFYSINGGYAKMSV